MSTRTFNREILIQEIKKVSSFSDEELQKYFDTEDLLILHSIKLYTDDVYYNTGEPSGFEDYQYDMLKETLQKRDPEYTPPIGVQIREDENKVDLPFWLSGIETFKSKDKDKIEKWIKNNPAKTYIVEDKLDGVSGLLVREDGDITLYTRGDGHVGSDITHLSKYLKLPKLSGQTIAVRGELVIDRDVFDRKYANTYSNPRNMVSGLVNAKSMREGIKDLDFVVYEIVGDDIMSKPSEQLEKLKEQGFKVVNHDLIDDISLEKLEKLLFDFKEKANYEIDGIIIQPNIPYERSRSGLPEYAMAFKIDIIKETEVVEVEWNVSKWGALKPRVKIKPVSLGGVTITYATGFNGKFILDNKIGKGANISITRSGEVIPFIVKVNKPSKEADMPDVEYRWNETKVDIYTEEFGDEKRIKLITTLFDKLSIKHVGEATVKKLYNYGLDTFLKIISADKDDLSEVESFGEKSIDRIYTNIRNGLKGVSIPLILGSSGIFGIGLGRKKLDTLFNDIPDLLTIYKDVSRDELMEMVMNVDGFSDKTATKIVNSVEDADKFLSSLPDYVTFKEVEKKSSSLKGMVAITSGFRDKELESNIVERGGKVTTSVSKKTTAVIVKNKDDTSSKIKKAKELGIKLYTKDEFIEEFGLE